MEASHGLAQAEAIRPPLPGRSTRDVRPGHRIALAEVGRAVHLAPKLTLRIPSPGPHRTRVIQSQSVTPAGSELRCVSPGHGLSVRAKRWRLHT
eukprot:344250-Rhodomonas_salina.2